MSAVRLAVLALLLVVAIALPAAARDESEEKKGPPPRPARLEWDTARRRVLMSVSYRDVIDAEIRKKLTRGLPTTIVMTGTVYRVGSDKPISTTAYSCKITWHVWEEVYRLEITREGRRRVRKTSTLTVEGVLRRCAEARRLLIADASQFPNGAALYVKVKVLVDPVSPEVIKRIKRWVSRPSGTAVAAPGDALFSTFTGLFLQRIGEAARQLEFITRPVVPKEPPKPKKKKGDG